MLVNVYFNPGADGALMEYGYRGTPAVVALAHADALVGSASTSAARSSSASYAAAC